MITALVNDIHSYYYIQINHNLLHSRRNKEFNFDSFLKITCKNITLTIKCYILRILTYKNMCYIILHNK